MFQDRQNGPQTCCFFFPVFFSFFRVATCKGALTQRSYPACLWKFLAENVPGIMQLKMWAGFRDNLDVQPAWTVAHIWHQGFLRKIHPSTDSSPSYHKIHPANGGQRDCSSVHVLGKKQTIISIASGNSNSVECDCLFDCTFQWTLF